VKKLHWEIQRLSFGRLYGSFALVKWLKGSPEGFMVYVASETGRQSPVI
jgi:hypothetical protein